MTNYIEMKNIGNTAMAGARWLSNNQTVYAVCILKILLYLGEMNLIILIIDFQSVYYTVFM